MSVTDRAVYVYRLVISYPPGSQEPGWKPACWDALLRDVKDKRERAAVRKRGFRWPRERKFMSASAAYRRSLLLQWFGATVDVQRSEPVTWWPSPESLEQGVEPDDAEFIPRWAGPEYALVTVDEAARFSADVKPVAGLDLLRDQADLYASLRSPE